MARKKRTIDPASADPQANSTLCNLPPELRNRIWELVLFMQPDSDGKVRTSVQKRDQNKNSVLRLLETCRLIHNDAIAMFYDMNHLEISWHPRYVGSKAYWWNSSHPLDEGLQSLRRLSEPRLAGLRQITVDIRGSEWMVRLARLFKQLPHPPRLETITVILDPGFSVTAYPYTVATYSEWSEEAVKRELPFAKRNLRRFPQVKQLKFELRGKDHPTSYVQKALLDIEQAMPYAKAARAAKAAPLAAGPTAVE